MGFLIVGLVLLIGACSTTQAAPELTPDVEAELIAEAMDRACYGVCSVLTPYVRDSLFKSNTTVGNELPMTLETTTAIEEVLDEPVTFVSYMEAKALFDDGGLVQSGSGVLLSAGPVEELADGVVGIEIGVITALDGGRGEVYQFAWDGDIWVPATSDETGVVTTEWVS